MSFDDSPFANTNDLLYFFLETFEEGYLSVPGVTVSSNWVVQGPGPYTDSVDGDDGVIDNSGTNGHSFYSGGTESNLTVTFDAAALGGRLPTKVGIVCTDIGRVLFGTDGFGNVTFQAWDAQGVWLGAMTQSNFGDGSALGSGPDATLEDRFFGVFDPDGISRISLSVDDSTDWEVDHLQYGFTAPRLSIGLLEDGSAVLTWPANAAGFTLQQTPSLSPPNWTDVSNLPLVTGYDDAVILPRFAGSGFFRLAGP